VINSIGVPSSAGSYSAGQEQAPAVLDFIDAPAKARLCHYLDIRWPLTPGQTATYEEGIALTLRWYRQAPHQRFTALGT
jgi:hypothetical protein